MLTEYSISPHIFDYECVCGAFPDKSDWTRALRSFCNSLVDDSRDEPCGILIANIFDGLWLQKVQNMVDDKTRLNIYPDLRTFLCSLKERKILLHREKHDPNIMTLGENEEEWVRESQRLKGKSLVHHVVTSVPMLNEKAFSDPSLHKPFSPTQSVQSDIDSEVKCLEPFLSRCTALAITCPYICERKDDKNGMPSSLEFHKEYGFVRELIRYKTASSQNKKQLAQVDFFINDVTIKNIFSVEKTAQRIKDDVQTFFGGKVRIFARPNVVERRLFFGKSDVDGTFSMRWAVATTHYARENAPNNNGDKHVFSLLSPFAADDCYDFYYNKSRLINV